MIKRASAVVFLLAISLSWPGKALAQTETPEALAAAKELMTVSQMTDQLKQMLPAIIQQMKPLIARGNPIVERDYDAFAPVMQAAMNSRLEAFVNEGAKIYARHFTPEELRQVTNFYRTPAGAKFIREQPTVMKESMALGQQWGQAIGEEVGKRMIEELRKRGHNI
jgi:hypothetical protein